MKSKKITSNAISKYGVLVVFIIMFVFFAIYAPNFTKVRNIMNVSRQINTLGICAVGMTLLLIAGSIDLSMGYQLSLINVLCAFFMVKAGMGMAVSILLCLVIGCVIGLINGLIIVKSGVHPMIITLGTSQALNGISFLISNGIPIYGFEDGFSKLGQGSIGGIIPNSLIIMLSIMVIGYFILTWLPYGRYLYAVGSNVEAAKLAGVNTNRVTITAHTLCAFFTSIAAILLLSRTNSGLSTNGAGFEFNVITACVLGGVSNMGGRGTMYNAVIGVLIMGFLENGMLLMNVNEYWQLVVKGILLLIAVCYDMFMIRRGERVKKVKAINSENA